MEELASLIPIIIIAVISAISKSAKKQQQQQHPYQGMNAARPPQPAPAAQPATPAQPVTRPAAPAVPKPAQPASMASKLPTAPHTVAQPMVHTHLAPDCDTHDAPASGSLKVVSPEGKDPCHDGQMPRQVRTALPEEAADQPGLSLDWSADSLVKAFVMQEVLTRPCDRRRH